MGVFFPSPGTKNKLRRRPIAQRGDSNAFLELHIEQGPVLEDPGHGEGTWELSTVLVCLTQTARPYAMAGPAGHAGNTPRMTSRRVAELGVGFGRGIRVRRGARE